ncbi:unnamed protein product [Blepharisma stoltei]|uniref:DNA sliding clamp PCNA n=1 Tax=Blepharisma stoltei TaxID=1481888 RepID=A0AAU9JU09_9CILI|nr:unnamed protein product [Blepharisma stoltei]
MFEALLSKALILKRIVEALKELVTDVNFECTPAGISLQAMDASHVALVTFILDANGFDEFRCDRAQTLGLSITNLGKILKCAENDDRVQIRAEDNASIITFIFEGKDDDKVSEFNLNLLNLDSEHLGIPEQEYPCVITLPSAEFTRICRDMSQMTETLAIEVTKQSVHFKVGGDIGEGKISLKPKNDGKNKVHLEVNENVSCSYALRYLNLFNKGASLGDEAVLMIATDLPLVLIFNFELGVLKYYLAPKVSED